MFIYKLLKNPFFYFILLLTLAESLAWVFFPYRNAPKSSEVSRKPHIRRAWPEFFRGREEHPKKEPLIVIISHSQGVGGEIRDPEKVYAAYLQNEFLKHGIPGRVENWSAAGLVTTDLEILSIKAVQRKADLVIFAVNYRNINPMRLVNLDYPNSDLALLAGDPSLWPYLSGTLFFTNVTWDDILKKFFYLHSFLLRTRFVFYDSLTAAVPPGWHQAVFGKEMEVVKFQDIRDRPAADQEKKQPFMFLNPLLVRDVSNKDTEMKIRFPVFQRFYPLLYQRMKKGGVPFLWVWTPVAMEALPEKAALDMPLLNEEFSKVVRNSGVRCLDLSGAVPTERFLGFAHMDEEGHRLFSQLLFPEIVRELRKR